MNSNIKKKTKNVAQTKRSYIEGCEPNHLDDYFSHPLSKYMHAKRYKTIMEFLPGKGLLLDLGCGYGVFESEFLSKMKELAVVGVDINSKALKFAQNRSPIYDFLQCDIEALPFRNKTFDYVVATEVIEHAPNPSESLKELKRVCKNFAIITVPNVLNPSFSRVVGERYVSKLIFFSNFSTKIGRLMDFILSRLRWTIIGLMYIKNQDFFDCEYFGVTHRLYKPNSFLSLLCQANLKLICIQGTTLIVEILPRTFYIPFISFLSLIDNVFAKKKWKQSLVMVALCSTH